MHRTLIVKIFFQVAVSLFCFSNVLRIALVVTVYDCFLYFTVWRVNFHCSFAIWNVHVTFPLWNNTVLCVLFPNYKAFIVSQSAIKTMNSFHRHHWHPQINRTQRSPVWHWMCCFLSLDIKPWACLGAVWVNHSWTPVGETERFAVLVHLPSFAIYIYIFPH